MSGYTCQTDFMLNFNEKFRKKSLFSILLPEYMSMIKNYIILPSNVFTSILFSKDIPFPISDTTSLHSFALINARASCITNYLYRLLITC